jgi:hypothetical protein
MMKTLLRRNLLLLMLGVTAAAYTLSLGTSAFAKNGSDDSSSSSGSGSSGSSGSGSGGGDDNSADGEEHSGSGSHHDGHDDNSSTGGSSDDDNDSNDDSNDRSASNDDGTTSGGANNAARPRIQINVDAATRAGLLNGTLVAVDNLGRPLEVEAEIRNGQGVLIAKPHGGDAKRNPGAIASFDIVPAAQAPVHQ